MWLAMNTMQPVPDLFAVDATSPEYNEGQRKGTFYAQSWALVHYLLSTDEAKRAKFGEWMTAVAKGNDPSVMFWTIFETDPDTLYKEMTQYAKQRKYGFYKRPAIELEEAKIETRPLEHVEVLARLGDLLAHRRPLHAESAEAHLQKALELSPGHPGATLSLARLREYQEHFDEADALYAKAGEKGQRDADVLAASGARTIRAWYATDPPRRLRETPEALLNARSLLLRALELDSDQPEAMQWLGKTYALGDDGIEDGLAALRRAIEVFPRRTDLVSDLIVTLANGGRVDEASDVLESVYVRRARDSHEVGDLRNIIESGRYNQAINKSNEGDVDAAIEILETLESSSNKELAQQAAATHTRLAATRDHNRIVAAYNEAVLLTNQGKHDEALAQLKKMLENPPKDVSLAEAIRKLHDNLESR